MKQALIITALCGALSATQASAACIATYKAKKDNPLRLEQSTVIVPGDTCTAAAVQADVAAQLAARGWTLLSILSVQKSG